MAEKRATDKNFNGDAIMVDDVPFNKKKSLIKFKMGWSKFIARVVSRPKAGSA